MAELPANEDGAYSIVFDGNLEVEIVPMGSSRFLLRSRLPVVPEDDREREALLKACLQRHLAQLHWSPATVTWDKQSGCLWLYRAADATKLDARAALELLEDFVNAAEAWSRFEPAPPAPAFSNVPFNMMMRP